jgi:hypothetical protein
MKFYTVVPLCVVYSRDAKNLAEMLQPTCFQYNGNWVN